MGQTVTIRLNAEAGRTLRDLVRRSKTTKSAVIKKALQSALKTTADQDRPSAREVYARLRPSLTPAPPGPKRDRARHTGQLLKEILLAKRRAGTL